VENMSEKELISAIRDIVREELKSTNEEIGVMKKDLKSVKERLDKHDQYFESIINELGQVKQKETALENKVNLIGTRQEQQFKFLVTELGKVKETIEEMTGGYYV